MFHKNKKVCINGIKLLFKLFCEAKRSCVIRLTRPHMLRVPVRKSRATVKQFFSPLFKKQKPILCSLQNRPYKKLKYFDMGADFKFSKKSIVFFFLLNTLRKLIFERKNYVQLPLHNNLDDNTLVQLSFICNNKTTHCFYIDNNTLSSTYLLLNL